MKPDASTRRLLVAALGSTLALLVGSKVAIAVCFRHSATAFGFNDAMWGKYSKAMNATPQLTDPNTKQPPTTNLFYSVDYGTALPNFGSTIQDLGKSLNPFRHLWDGDTRVGRQHLGGDRCGRGHHLQGACGEHDPEQPHGRRRSAGG
jgi:hypothetical protein